MRNPKREILLSLLAAVLFGAGLFAYIRSTIKVPQPPALRSQTRPAGSEPLGPSRAEQARRIATNFVEHLAASRHDKAYALMADAYRQSTPLEAFRASCAASPFVSSAERVSLSRTREESAAAEPARRSLSASGVMNTTAGSVDVTFWFVDSGAGVAIANMTVAGFSVLSMAR